MKGMKIYGSFQYRWLSRSQYHLAAVTLKYDNHGGGQAMLLARIMGRGARYCVLSINWTGQVKSRRKTRIKGITRLSNIPNGLNYSFLTDLCSYMGDFSRYVRGYSAKISAQVRVGLIGVVNVLDWD